MAKWDSSTSVEEIAQHDPHEPWFLMGLWYAVHDFVLGLVDVVGVVDVVGGWTVEVVVVVEEDAIGATRARLAPYCFNSASVASAR